mmetsp:Transcript_36786/g.87084  ORF Transcript_36786/g.87084 Transcript_36786/m.87084 type:complete len:350 (+) Transcript_36786:1268-2317(+)
MHLLPRYHVDPHGRLVPVVAQPQRAGPERDEGVVRDQELDAPRNCAVDPEHLGPHLEELHRARASAGRHEVVRDGVGECWQHHASRLRVGVEVVRDLDIQREEVVLRFRRNHNLPLVANRGHIPQTRLGQSARALLAAAAPARIREARRRERRTRNRRALRRDGGVRVRARGLHIDEEARGVVGRYRRATPEHPVCLVHRGDVARPSAFRRRRQGVFPREAHHEQPQLGALLARGHPRELRFRVCRPQRGAREVAQRHALREGERRGDPLHVLGHVAPTANELPRRPGVGIRHPDRERVLHRAADREEPPASGPALDRDRREPPGFVRQDRRVIVGQRLIRISELRHLH